MSKKIIAALVCTLCFFGSSNALEAQSHVDVKNAIIPLNSNYAPQLTATIAISNIRQTVAFGSSFVLNVKPNDIGAIVVNAPFCGEYLGFDCFVPLPEDCINSVGSAGKLLISGLITEYGLDRRSLRCYYIPDEIESISVPTTKKHCLF